MAEEVSIQSRQNGFARASGSSAQASLSPLRQRPLGRAATFGDITSPRKNRRGSLLSVSESVDEAQKSLRSSTDDLLLPKVRGSGLETHHEPSHWHSAPLALALLPAVGGLLFQNGGAIVTDVTLLVLAAVFLNWSVRVPWDWYCSAQSIRLKDPHTSDDFYPGNAIIEEESEEEEEQSKPQSLEPQATSPTLTKTNSPQIEAIARAESELRIHELLALLACFVSPVIGAWLLHTIRSQLSRPSEGLVSNYNLTIFLLGAELRPLSHLIKMVQSRTLHLQRLVASNPYESVKVDPAQVLDLSKRVYELESHIADASAANEELISVNPAYVTTDVRKSLQPDLDALNRAVRRYEKRATLLTLQTESRLQDLESRMADAITLAAAAERGNAASRRGSASVLLDWLCALIVVPIKSAYSAITLPLRAAAMVLRWFEGWVGRQMRVEMRTVGRAAAPFPPKPITNHRRGFHSLTTTTTTTKTVPSNFSRPFQLPVPSHTSEIPLPPVAYLPGQVSRSPRSPLKRVSRERRRVRFFSNRSSRKYTTVIPKPWNPINTSSKAFDPLRSPIKILTDPFDLPSSQQPVERKDEHPLLTAAEKRLSQQNSLNSPSSIIVEPSIPSPDKSPLPPQVKAEKSSCTPQPKENGKQLVRNPPTPQRSMSVNFPLQNSDRHKPPFQSQARTRSPSHDLERGTYLAPSSPQPPQTASTTHTPTGAQSPTLQNFPPWGPSHPCYPHPNPHVPLASPLYPLTRIIRIPRDWLIAGDLAPQYSQTYPEVLSPWVSEAQFRCLISGVNDGLKTAYDPWSSANWADAFLGLATGWLWEDFKGGVSGKTGRRGVGKVERFLEDWNRQLELGKGEGSSGEEGEELGLVKAIGLRRTGYMSLDIQIPDPRISIADDDPSDSERERPLTGTDGVDQAPGVS
ncbi:MAG: hypothetical protein MMC33_001099 [Icmadophila ericetorum]|nr:hypothetical protein [Icmadophila ericetorum]